LRHLARADSMCPGSVTRDISEWLACMRAARRPGRRGRRALRRWPARWARAWPRATGYSTRRCGGRRPPCGRPCSPPACPRCASFHVFCTRQQELPALAALSGLRTRLALVSWFCAVGIARASARVLSHQPCVMIQVLSPNLHACCTQFASALLRRLRTATDVCSGHVATGGADAQVNQAQAEAGAERAGAAAEVWPALARAFEAFLLGADALQARMAPAACMLAHSRRAYRSFGALAGVCASLDGLAVYASGAGCTRSAAAHDAIRCRTPWLPVRTMAAPVAQTQRPRQHLQARTRAASTGGCAATGGACSTPANTSLKKCTTCGYSAKPHLERVHPVRAGRRRRPAAGRGAHVGARARRGCAAPAGGAPAAGGARAPPAQQGGPRAGQRGRQHGRRRGRGRRRRAGGRGARLAHRRRALWCAFVKLCCQHQRVGASAMHSNHACLQR